MTGVVVTDPSATTLNPKLEEFKKRAQEFYDAKATEESEELAEEAYGIARLVSADTPLECARAGRMLLEQGSRD